MATLYTQRAANIQKTWLLMAVFLSLIVGIAWIVSALYGAPEILWIAIAFALIMNITSYWFSHKIVISMTGAREADPNTYWELHRIVENLAITAGLPKPKIYVIDDPAPNAFATGRNPEHGIVVFTTGILQLLDRAELEGVAAHELAHIGNRDILLGTVVVVLVGFIAILSDMFIRSMWFGGGRTRDNRANPLLLIIGIIFVILAPIAAKLIQLAISRKREFLADATGALLTRYPEGLASALQKIATHAMPLRRASHATAHLFIENPFGEKSRGVAGYINTLFATHPPTEERIAALLSMRVDESLPPQTTSL